jgi:uracil-DNA glycosylase
VSDLRRYLEQQRALYGDALVLDVPVHDIPTESPAPLPPPPVHTSDGDMRRQAAASTHVPIPPERWQGATSLEALREAICTCRACPLGDTRTNFVFGTGNAAADIVLVGEAPGGDEDRVGEPFVGRAGQLLTKILEAIDLKRDDVYICNIIKCRPPENRDPLPAEVEQCEPYLHAQLRIVRPKIMLALGRIAAQTLLRTNASLTKLRADVHRYEGIPMLVTYHPAALLRNPNWKQPTWEDVQRFRGLYDRIRAGEVV